MAGHFFAAKSTKNRRKSANSGAASWMLPYAPGRKGSAESERGNRSAENAAGVRLRFSWRKAR